MIEVEYKDFKNVFICKDELIINGQDFIPIENIKKIVLFTERIDGQFNRILKFILEKKENKFNFYSTIRVYELKYILCKKFFEYKIYGIGDAARVSSNKNRKKEMIAEKKVNENDKNILCFLKNEKIKSLVKIYNSYYI